MNIYRLHDRSRFRHLGPIDIQPWTSRVAREFDAIADQCGYPCLVVSDNGTELTCNAMLKWQQDRGVEWHYIAP